MKVHEVMRKAPMVIDASASVVDAQRRMTAYQFRHLPVVERDKLLGLVSQQDLFAARSRLHGERAWGDYAVRDVMPPHCQTAGPDDSVTELIGRMAESKLDGFPVVLRGALVGIVTVIDILEAEVRRAMDGGQPPPASCGLPPTVRPEDPLFDGIQLMYAHGVRNVPVVDERGRVVAVLSDVDVRRVIGDPALYLASSSPLHYSVEDVMDTKLVTASPDRSLAEIAHEFCDERVDAVAIVDSEGFLTGMVGYIDALVRLGAEPRRQED